eukprot:8750662-Alexandrium_andersonii.AAC.1
MSASLVGSEMCIRDRSPAVSFRWDVWWQGIVTWLVGAVQFGWHLRVSNYCLLYTSDAADDM